MANNLCLHSFPDPVCHFVAPWWPFRIFWRWYHVLIEGVLGSKNLFSESRSEWPITYVYTPFQTPSAICGPLVAISDFLKVNIRCCVQHCKIPWQNSHLFSGCRTSAGFGPLAAISEYEVKIQNAISAWVSLTSTPACFCIIHIEAKWQSISFIALH